MEKCWKYNIETKHQKIKIMKWKLKIENVEWKKTPEIEKHVKNQISDLMFS